MRVEVTLQNILDYGLDVITGNSRQELLDAAARAKEMGVDPLTVSIPDVVGGDTEIPRERNTFEHFGPDLPEPEGAVHEQEALDLHQQASNIPTYAYLKGKGKVRVIAYLGNDYFDVLTNRDERVHVHRDRLKFLKEEKKDD